MSNTLITVVSGYLMAVAVAAIILAAVNEIRARRDKGTTSSVVLAPTTGRNPYSITERDWS